MIETKKNPPLPSGYALWFVPEDPVFEKTSQVIQELSARYSSPNFEPHISLLGVWEGSESIAAEKAERTAQGLSPFHVRFDSIGSLDYYFRNLFIRLEDSPELTHAYEYAHHVFGIQKPAPFMPHLSLYYGNLPVQEKEALAKELETQFKHMTLIIKNLSLYFISSDLNEWRCIKTLPLAGKE